VAGSTVAITPTSPRGRRAEENWGKMTRYVGPRWRRPWRESGNGPAFHVLGWAEEL
jgi:hypothetical protein